MRQKIPPNRCRISAGGYFKFGIRFAECLVGVANADVFLGDCLNKTDFRAVFVEGNDGFIIFPVNRVRYFIFAVEAAEIQCFYRGFRARIGCPFIFYKAFKDVVRLLLGKVEVLDAP